MIYSRSAFVPEEFDAEWRDSQLGLVRDQYSLFGMEYDSDKGATKFSELTHTYPTGGPKFYRTVTVATTEPPWAVPANEQPDWIAEAIEREATRD